MDDRIYTPEEQNELNEINGKLRELVDVDRRVISRKETISYILFNSAKGFNIDGHKDLFTDSILHIGFNLVSALELLYDLPWEHFEELYSLCLCLGAFGVMLLLCLFFFQQRIFFRDGDDEVSAPVRVQEKDGKK